MNESLEYEKMIEIPLASCEYVRKRRHRLLKKRKLIKEVNSKIEGALECGDCFNCEKTLTNGDNFACSERQSDLDCDSFAERADGENSFSAGNADLSENLSVGYYDNKPKNKSGFRAFWRSLKNKEDRSNAVITAQIAVAFLLAATIILTNVFWENSGINTLFKSVFGVEQKQEDNRVYSDFSLNLPVRGEGLTYTEGAINVNGETFIYPVCDGKISKIEKTADGKYTVTVNHSDSFKSVVSGADFVCFNAGESVNSKIPLCHTEQGATVYLYDNDELITEYAAKEDYIVWNK